MSICGLDKLLGKFWKGNWKFTWGSSCLLDRIFWDDSCQVLRADILLFMGGSIEVDNPGINIGADCRTDPHGAASVCIISGC